MLRLVLLDISTSRPNRGSDMERFYIQNAITDIRGGVSLTMVVIGYAETIRTTAYWYGSKQYDTVRALSGGDDQPFGYRLPYNIPLDVMVRLEVSIDRRDPVIIYLYQPTQPINNPTAGTLRPSSYHSATRLGWEWGGFQAVGSGYSYEYSLEKEGASQPEWSRLDYNVEQMFFDGLDPETTYTFRLRMKDSEGYYSDVLCSTQTTDIDQTRVGFNDGGQFKRARVWVNKDGKIKKVNRIYRNVGGSIKLIKNL